MIWVPYFRVLPHAALLMRTFLFHSTIQKSRVLLNLDHWAHVQASGVFCMKERKMISPQAYGCFWKYLRSLPPSLTASIRRRGSWGSGTSKDKCKDAFGSRQPSSEAGDDKPVV